eukprot:4633693-Pleurochrysis_carterae.AAC.2
MAAAAPTDELQEASVAELDVSTTVHIASHPQSQHISATAPLRHSLFALVSALPPFPSNYSAYVPKGFMLYNACSRGQIHLDELGFSALLVASKKGHSQVHASPYGAMPLRALLAAGANPNLSCVWGDTPLFVTAVAGHRCCMQLLLAKGSDLYHRNHHNKSVVDAVVDELRRRRRGPSMSRRLKLKSCLELAVATHTRALQEAEAHADVVDIEGAVAVVINSAFELHVVSSQLIPTRSPSYDFCIGTKT